MLRGLTLACGRLWPSLLMLLPAGCVAHSCGMSGGRRLRRQVCSVQPQHVVGAFTVFCKCLLVLFTCVGLAQGGCAV